MKAIKMRESANTSTAIVGKNLLSENNMEALVTYAQVFRVQYCWQFRNAGTENIVQDSSYPNIFLRGPVSRTVNMYALERCLPKTRTGSHCWKRYHPNPLFTRDYSYVLWEIDCSKSWRALRCTFWYMTRISTWWAGLRPSSFETVCNTLLRKVPKWNCTQVSKNGQ